jgi:predicted DNA-binding transcriptional regulator AlpA
MTAFSRWALVCVVAAAGVLATLGFVSLRQWERSAELVARDQARDMAAMAAEKVEMVLRDVPPGVLLRLQAAAATGPAALEAALADEAVRDALEKTLGARETPTVLALLDAAHAGNGAPDRLLTAEQVAERLNLDVKTVYRQAGKWPFTKRLGPKRLRFSEHGLARHLASLPSPR